MIIDYDISTVAPYINWAYFFHAWGLTGKPLSEQEALRQEADAMLREIDGHYRTHAIVCLYRAYGDDDDIVLAAPYGETVPPGAPLPFRLPLLRQQQGSACTCHPRKSLCLADFVRPQSRRQGGVQADAAQPSAPVAECVGVFAATADAALERDFRGDDYRQLLAQTLADQLTEATVELMHLQVRRRYWGYAPDEQLPLADLLAEHFQGIRPAVGYPSLPDVSLNFLLDELLSMQQIGITLTENGMMRPHASVSGLMLAHPQAHYFDVGPVGYDQLCDYARRRGMSVEDMRRFLRRVV